MNFFEFQFRTTFRKIYIPTSLIVTVIALYNLIFNPESFDTVFNYCIGWIVWFFVIVIPNIALLIESEQDWEKQKFE